jgi:uncharacterized repeat protein (TIGR03847 family)
VLIELDPVDRITAGAVGSPGSRVFYLQGRQGDQLITLLLEKQQVQLLAASVVEILARVGKETGQGPPEEQMELEEPLVPEWRAGRLSIGYHEERDLLLLEVEEVADEETTGDDEDEDADDEDDEAEEASALGPSLGTLDDIEAGVVFGTEPEDGDEEEDLDGLPEPADSAVQLQRVRFWATREQMLSLARHGAAVCARGRPRCQLCGNPMDEDGGHRCPALNGHGGAGE